MKFLVALSALVAIAFAKPGYFAAGPVAPGLLAAPGLRYIGAPSFAASPLAYSAPAFAASPLAYSASAIAAPLAYSGPAIAAAPVAIAAPAIRSQYHSQDELGNAAFGHSEPGQVHSSVQDAAGNRVGSFSYLNPTDGQIHRTDYVADAAGYRVAANDLPVAPAAPVADTPEVVAARAAHLALHRARRSALLQTPASTAPLATHVAVAPAPLAYSTAPVAVAPAHLAYSAASVAVAPAHLAYSAAVAPAHLAYSSAPLAPAQLAYSAVPAGIPATLTTIVNNPGHAVSYRVD